MISFLKKYSSVPERFINDFFSITGEKYVENELVIDFNIVAKWLDVVKGNLKVTLVKHFSENIDYIITKVTNKHASHNGASVEENIMVTPSCFKSLCMISTSKNAHNVRMYYISLEKLIMKYHYYIEEKLREKNWLIRE